MNKNSTAIAAILAAMAVAAALTGCGDTTEEESSVEETTAATEVSTTEAAETEAVTTQEITTEAAAEEYAVIGTMRSGDTIETVKLTNNTGHTITSVAICYDDDEGYCDNMLPGQDVYLSDETRMLYYDTSDALEACEESEDEDAPSYCVLLTFDDDTTAELHDFPFDDIEDEADICLEDGIAYLRYFSAETGEDISTLEDEQQWLEDHSESSEEAEESSEEEDTYSYYEESSYVYYEYTYEETPAAESSAAQEESSEEIVEETPVEDETAAEDNTDEDVIVEESTVSDDVIVEEDNTDGGDVNDGCIGDEGLFY